ncbi:RraA family protein [Sphingobium sp. JS3065]|uniref:RraA family protein n=1 Tax=Sphingobium sp. JS3065 TaxID=2970925 RepID=UPI00226521DD|nr:RraA family protein [Sphingobium sp. JS3065]UZW57538.1 RraA family protein [Sphingobium sp. JS3065]
MTFDYDSATGLSSATVHEASGKIGALPSCIKPVAPGLTLSGPAFPVQSPPGDNLFLHHAIYAAPSGAVLVIDCGDAAEFGHWGEVMAVAAQSVGIRGLVIHGGVRDAARMAEIGFPVFASNICIRGTGKDPQGKGQIGGVVTIGDISVHAGDLVIADEDGVMIVPADRAAAVVAESRARDEAEQDYFRRLRAGETTLAIYGLPDIVGK